MVNHKRMLFSSSCTCKFGCRYCFAKFDCFVSMQNMSVFSLQTIGNDYVIYPTCDGEFFNDKHAMIQLENFVNSTKNQIKISVSIKYPITLKQALFLQKLNQQLINDGRGFIKCSLSITTKHNVEKYEPNTPDYSKRIQALKLLAEVGIPTSVNLKPILPFVPVDEYCEIIQDTSAYAESYLIGGLYIDIKTKFGLMVSTNYPHLISTRVVNWLPGKPLWNYCEDSMQIESIRQFIIKSDRKIFDSDIDLIGWLSSKIYQRIIRSSNMLNSNMIIFPAALAEQEYENLLINS